MTFFSSMFKFKLLTIVVQLASNVIHSGFAVILYPRTSLVFSKLSPKRSDLEARISLVTL